MKSCQIFALVILAVCFNQANTLFLHGGQASGNLAFSGNFHGLLANHPWLGKKEAESTVEPVTEAPTTTTTTTTAEPQPTDNEVNVGGSAGIDFNKIIGDAIARHVTILQHVQSGVLSRFESHIKRLEKFENHVHNHFNKGSKGSISVKGDFDFGPASEGDSVSSS